MVLKVMLKGRRTCTGLLRCKWFGLSSVGRNMFFLHELGRVNYDSISDRDAIEAFFKLSRYEGISCFGKLTCAACAMKLAKEKKHASILVNLSVEVTRIWIISLNTTVTVSNIYKFSSSQP